MAADARLSTVHGGVSMGDRAKRTREGGPPWTSQQRTRQVVAIRCSGRELSSGAVRGAVCAVRRARRSARDRNPLPSEDLVADGVDRQAQVLERQRRAVHDDAGEVVQTERVIHEVLVRVALH